MRSPYLRGPRDPVRVVGHRGAAALAPENTIPAFEAGLRAGADALEFDVQRTADGVPVVLHDETLDRTTDGSGPLASRTLEEVRHLDAGSWHSPTFAGTRVPSLDDVLAWAAPRTVELVLELKQPIPASGRPRDGGLVANVLAALRAHDLLARTLLISFDHPSIAAAIAAEPRARTALLAEGPALVDPLAPARAVPGTLGLHLRWIWVDRATCDAAHAAGLHVHAWGLRTLDRDVVLRLVAAGVDSLSADAPDELVALLGREGLR